MAEIRQLTNIIHQLEKKLGVESGHYIRLQLEKDSLRNKLDRIKGNETSGRKSPSSTSRTDLSSDLSMFSYPSVSIYVFSFTYINNFNLIVITGVRLHRPLSRNPGIRQNLLVGI